MQVEIPQDLLKRIQQRASAEQGGSEADVIRRAMDSLDWHENERKAIQEGLDDLKNGEVVPYDQFAREFLAQNDIAQES